MATVQELEKQLAELKKAQNDILNKVDCCMRPADGVRAGLWKEVVPFAKAAVEQRIKGGEWDQREIYKVVAEKVFTTVFGQDIFTQLELFK